MICEFPGGINCRWFFMIAGLIDLKSAAGVKVSKLKTRNLNVLASQHLVHAEETVQPIFTKKNKTSRSRLK